MLKRIGLSLLAVMSVVGIAVASGQFSGLPIINGTSYCFTSVNGICQQTIPAGPALTGNELAPVDTGTTQGLNPATAYLPMAALGAGPYQYNAPLTGASLTLTAQQRRLVVEPAGTIAALTVVFPAATTLVDGQLMGLCSTQIVTALTVTAGTGTTVLNAPTAMTVPLATGAASCVEWVYRQTNTSWYRVQ
jgi:hypothetical protein